MDLDNKALGLGQSPALLLIDMINGFTDPVCALGHECDAVIAVNQTLLERFRTHGLPVIYTTVVYDNDAQARVFREKIPVLNLLQRGSKWVEIDQRVQAHDGEAVIEKHWASAFRGTDLDAHLTKLGVDSLVVTGLTTSGCVRASAVDGLQYDYRVVVVEDAVSDRNADAHRANLFDLQAKYTDVANSASILSALAVR